MKKINISTLFIAVAMPFMVFAQSPTNRSANTIVADVMAQMPANNQAKFNEQMEALASKGEETVSILLKMMKSPASEGNNQIEYALGGLSYFVAQNSKVEERKEVTKAYIDALEKTNDRETKAFIIRQIQITGVDDAVETLKKYAVTNELYAEACRALVSIGTDNAKKAISSIVNEIPNKKVAAKSIGDLNLVAHEELLLSWLNKGDADLQKTIFNALGKIGSEKTFELLTKEVYEISYNYEANGVLEAYLMTVARLAKNDPDTYTKVLVKLLKNKSFNVKTFAVTTLGELKNSVVFAEAVKSLSLESRPYRNAALKAACKLNGEEFFVNSKINFAKLSDEAKTDVINVCGVNRYNVYTKNIIEALSSSNEELQDAAFCALGMIGSDDALTALVSVFAGDDAAKIKKSKETICWLNKDVNGALTQALDGASDGGKVAILNTLAHRGAKSSAEKVIGYTSSSDKNISGAAYDAIAKIATTKELSKLYQMLETAPKENVLDMQQAIGGALGVMAPNEAYAIIAKQLGVAAQDKKYLYYGILSFTNTPEAFKTIENGVKSSDKNIQTAAVESLLAWKNKEAIQAVYEVIENPALTSYLSSAVKSYISLVKSGNFTDQQRYLYIRKALETVKGAEEQNALLSQLIPLNSFGALMTASKYLSNPTTQHTAGTAILNIAQKDKYYDNWSKDVENILKQFIETRKGGDAGYEKTAIQTYIDGAPSSLGYVKIFNEKDLTGWKGLVQNPIARGKMSAKQLAEEQVKADELMKKGWEVRDGILYFTGHGDNLCTEKKYGDFEMYVDWYIVKDGDAGIYLRGTPQVQIWDTCRVDVGAQVGSGGLYNNSKNPSKPTSVADNHIGDWNTFYIKMVGERVTVVLNGIKVVDNVILENYWNRSMAIFIEEQLELQAHGTLVGYRDIYVKELPKVEPIALGAEEVKDGFKLLFDGVSMNKWIGNTKDYVAENGTITLNPKNGGGGNIYTEKEYKDFVFRFDFMLTEAANNGLGIRTPLEGDAAYVGMELQIIDNEHHVYKDLQKYQYHGSVYGVIPAKRGFLKPIGEWNSQEVYLKGNKIKITLNGEVILDGDLAEASKNGTLDQLDHPGLKNEKGHIGFLGHGSPVKFKNIRVKEL